MAKEKEVKEEAVCCPPNKKWRGHNHGLGGGAGFVFFAAFIGVAVYNVQQVSGFWPIVLALLKACVWPAFLMHHIFTQLHM